MEQKDNLEFVKIGEKFDSDIIYSPAKGLVSIVKKGNFEEEKLDELLENSPSIKVGKELPLDKKKRNQIGLFLTTACNADCIYCYAYSESKPLTMSFEIAKKGIDFITKQKNAPLDILFFGGGEPTLEFPLMKKIKEYADHKAKKTRLHIQSNGVFSKQILDWLIEQKALITISCDGPPEIQNKQRPLKAEKKSSSITENTIKKIVENYNPKKLHIQAIITELSVNRQLEIVEYFDRLGVKGIALDPFMKSKKSELSGLKEVKPSVFSKNFLKAREFSEQIGINTNSGLLQIHRMPYTCDFCVPQFCLTPRGFVSSCLETVSSEIGPQEFIYGKLSGNKFEFDEEKMAKMSSRRVENMEKCRDCFLKPTCAGGCASHCLKKTGNMFEPSLEDCEFVKESVKKYLLFKAEKGLYSVTPAIKEKKNNKYLLNYFSEFELGECTPHQNFRKNPFIKIPLSETNLCKLTESILEYRKKNEFQPVFFVLSFDLNQGNLNAESGQKIWKFLNKLKDEKVRFFVEKNFYPCMFENNYEDFLGNFLFFEREKKKKEKILKDCRECIYFLREKCKGFT